MLRPLREQPKFEAVEDPMGPDFTRRRRLIEDHHDTQIRHSHSRGAEHRRRRYVPPGMGAGPTWHGLWKRKTPTTQASESALTVRVRSRAAFAPTPLRALVQVTPHPDNRLLRVTLHSDRYYASSDIQLDGTGAPKSHFLVWKAPPPGEYGLEAIVHGATGPRAWARQGYRVLGPGAEFDLTWGPPCTVAVAGMSALGPFSESALETPVLTVR